MSGPIDHYAIRFLSRYGYVNELFEDSIDPIDLSLSQLTGDLADALQGKESKIQEGLLYFQNFYGLEPSGRLDPITRDQIRIPRCTLKDEPKSAKYNLGRRWNKRFLTWRVLKYPSNDLGEHRVRNTLERAFSVWSKHANLTFIEDLDTDTPDIGILWVAGDHDDGDPFDKAGGTLAHAFFPGQGELAGDIHFDDDEQWTLGSYSGVNLTQVAVHEIGHSLGLEHTNVRGAIMFPSYEGYRPHLELADDDIKGIQSLYGPPKDTGDGRTLPPETEWIPGDKTRILSEICSSCSHCTSCSFTSCSIQ